MLLINNLTAPGGIRRVELRPETIKVIIHNGGERLYKLVAGEREDLQEGKVVGALTKANIGCRLM